MCNLRQLIVFFNAVLQYYTVSKMAIFLFFELLRQTVKLLHLTGQKIGHFGDALPSQLLN